MGVSSVPTFTDIFFCINSLITHGNNVLPTLCSSVIPVLILWLNQHNEILQDFWGTISKEKGRCWAEGSIGTVKGSSHEQRDASLRLYEDGIRCATCVSPASCQLTCGVYPCKAKSSRLCLQKQITCHFIYSTPKHSESAPPVHRSGKDSAFQQLSSCYLLASSFSRVLLTVGLPSWRGSY